MEMAVTKDKKDVAQKIGLEVTKCVAHGRLGRNVWISA